MIVLHTMPFEFDVMIEFRSLYDFSFLMSLPAIYLGERLLVERMGEGEVGEL